MVQPAAFMDRYVIISPVKDEERYVETTIRSVIAQTIRPARWLLVDDGSSDRTPEIIESYCRKHQWMSLLRLPMGAERGAGSPVVQAFLAGYEHVQGEEFDFIVKLDCDLRLPPTYFGQLLSRFETDARLGIASGIYLEQHDGAQRAIEMPEYHAAGACKVMRAECYRDIDGFVVSRGWDTVDEIRAQCRGWRTTHFADLPFEHLRPEGSVRGTLYTNRLHGEVFFLTGGPIEFFAFKVLQRAITGRPPLLAGLMLLTGYLKPWLLRKRRLVSRDEANHYRRQLRKRIVESLVRKVRLFGLRVREQRRA